MQAGGQVDSAPGLLSLLYSFVATPRSEPPAWNGTPAVSSRYSRSQTADNARFTAGPIRKPSSTLESDPLRRWRMRDHTMAGNRRDMKELT